jgi:hypothetical protein
VNSGRKKKNSPIVDEDLAATIRRKNENISPNTVYIAA